MTQWHQQALGDAVGQLGSDAAQGLPDSEVLPSVIELFGPTEPRRHAGSEFVYVLEGRLAITIGERRFKLDRGESISFRSAELHSYAPADGSARPARILSVRIDERPS